ncbi:MAG TPA: MBL fold metallo-hydrolase [Bacteroidales bacterium]|nr:MBL fold metallo-hydrolase [Bacteroidales bacterium]
MLKIKRFIFNPFEVNTYLIYNENNKAIIIDAGCYEKEEEKELQKFIIENNIQPIAQINTHCHIDHILGNYFVSKTFNIPLLIHKDGLLFLNSASYYANIFNINMKNVVKPSYFIDENSKINIDKEVLNVIYTPGHSNGSICIISHSNTFVITGDVLFYNSIGRTDLPTGNIEILLKNIKEKLMCLPESYKIYPGHGNFSYIGDEKNNNPFLK